MHTGAVPATDLPRIETPKSLGLKKIFAKNVKICITPDSQWKETQTVKYLTLEIVRFPG